MTMRLDLWWNTLLYMKGRRRQKMWRDQQWRIYLRREKYTAQEQDFLCEIEALWADRSEGISEKDFKRGLNAIWEKAANAPENIMGTGATNYFYFPVWSVSFPQEAS